MFILVHFVFLQAGNGLFFHICSRWQKLERLSAKSGGVEIGFVFSLSGKSQISIILLFVEVYVHFVSSEIGFVLHFYSRLGGSGVVGSKLGLFFRLWQGRIF